MAKSRTSETLMAFSTNPELTYNAMVLLAASMTAFKTRTPALPVPDTEKFDDLGEIGGGINGEFPMEQRSGFVVPPAWDISNVVNTGYFLNFLRRFGGGADTPTVVEAAVAHQHLGGQLINNTAAGLQLPASTFAVSNNGADYLWGGVCGNGMTIAQTGADDPTFTMGVMGSGLYKRIRDVSGPAFGVLGAPAAVPKMLGPSTELEFTDPGGNVILTSAKRLMNISLTLGNALQTLRLAGASPIDPTNLTLGWYLDELLHGQRTAGAEMRIFLDDTMREFADARDNSVITGFKMRMRGNFIPGTAANNRYLVEIIFNKCFFRAARAGDDGGNAVLDIGVFPVSDGVSFGQWSWRAINGSAGAIV